MSGRDKQTVRLEMKARAAALSPEYRAAAGRIIREKLFALPAYGKAGTLMAYVSLPSEPDTYELIGRAAAEGRKILLPRCAEDGLMEAVPFNGWARMRRNAYGIPEPLGAAAAEPPDLILVPCLAATAEGVRLGHGAGYYDRFLRNQPGARICLCFRAMLADALPEDSWDVPMDLVLTE